MHGNKTLQGDSSRFCLIAVLDRGLLDHQFACSNRLIAFLVTTCGALSLVSVSPRAILMEFVNGADFSTPSAQLVRDDFLGFSFHGSTILTARSNITTTFAVLLWSRAESDRGPSGFQPDALPKLSYRTLIGSSRVPTPDFVALVSRHSATLGAAMRFSLQGDGLHRCDAVVVCCSHLLHPNAALSDPVTTTRFERATFRSAT